MTEQPPPWDGKQSKGDGTPLRAHRFEARLPAILLVEGEELACEAENFSRTGLLLSGRNDWPAASAFTLVIKSSTGDLQIPVPVRVVRRLTAVRKLAVEFSNPDDQGREGIEFLIQRVIEGRAHAPHIPEIAPGTPPHEVRKILETVPLPIRISLAARAGPKERESLLHDQSAAVLESLARNPSLLALEARALASSVHASPSVLTALGAEGRFAADEETGILVLAHPKVPPGLADRLVAALKETALRRALTKPTLCGAARSAIQKRLIRERRP